MIYFMPNWLLPENIADVLPSEARKIEKLRRRMLDNFCLYGYEMVIPPLLEYLESLLTGAGQDSYLSTFKLVDQLSGRTMGIRADMTTQVARIDAHLLNRNSITRLCYAGSVLHTRPSGLYATRESLQIGAEIYGYAGLEADAEIQELALVSLVQAGISDIRLDLCHVGVLRSLIANDTLASNQAAQLFSLLAAKDIAGLKTLTENYSETTRSALLILPKLYGDINIINKAKMILPALSGVVQALDELQVLAQLAGTTNVTIDLADLRGYHYHSGAMFAAYVPGLPNAVARGGRYDHVGEAFGRARPATGFSIDLLELVRLISCIKPKRAILAPWGTDAGLREKITELRQTGEIVIQSLPGHENNQDEFDCDRTIYLNNGNWTIKKIG